MGLLFVIGFWAVVLAILGVVASAYLTAVTAFLTRDVTSARKRALAAASLLPWLCIGVWVLGAIGYAGINVTLRDRDLGFGDGYQTPLPTGYVLEAIDILDTGVLYPPHRKEHTQPLVDPVVQLQVDAVIAAGSTTARADNSNWQRLPSVDRWFVLDMSRGTLTQFDSVTTWDAELARRGLAEHLAPFEEVFGRYRNNWFDWLAFGVAASVPLAALAIWVWLVVRARRTIPPAPGHGGLGLSL